MSINSNSCSQLFSFIKRETKEYINIDPLQTGGKLTKEALQMLIEWGDGYSVCDFCQGSLDLIKKPPIEMFIHKLLPDFLGIDHVRVTNGAREAKFAIFHSLAGKNDYVIMDALAHYSSKIAAERANLDIIFTKNPEAPLYNIDVTDFIDAINFGIRKYNKKPLIVLITYPDGNYGNLVNLIKIIDAVHEYDIPVLVNGAYCIGRMPFKANEVNADFVVASGHKSMSSSGPIGLVGFSEKYANFLLKKSKYSKIKNVEFLGCTARSSSIMTLMASFPSVLKRTEKHNWENEIVKAQKLSKCLEDTNQFKLIGDKPHRHDLMFYEASGFYNISLGSKDGRFFLYNELKKYKIHGIKPGLTKNFKISTFGLSNENINYIIDSFIDILKKYDQI